MTACGSCSATGSSTSRAGCGPRSSKCERLTSSRRPTSTSTPRAAWCSAAGWFARACSRLSGERALPLCGRERAARRAARRYGVDRAAIPAGREPRSVGGRRPPRQPPTPSGEERARCRSPRRRGQGSVHPALPPTGTTRRLPRVRGPRRSSRTLAGDCPAGQVRRPARPRPRRTRRAGVHPASRQPRAVFSASARMAATTRVARSADGRSPQR